MKLTEQAKQILRARYLLRDKDGNFLEDERGLFRRVANEVAEAEATPEDKYGYAEEFYGMMSRLDFLPNSPTLMNAGSNQGSSSACFVIPIFDSMEGIMKAATDIALVQKFGGGTGMALSRIRPKDSHISSTHGKACGPIQVLKTMSAVSSMVTQGGKRDGANMAILRVDHPDIREFIHCKDNVGLHNFNISVGITDEFMQAVEEDSEFVLRFDGVEYEKVKARALMQEIVESAWSTGDPGLWFIDRVNRGHGNPMLGWEILSCNPCGEQELYDYDACTLGSINLGNFVLDKQVDYLRLAQVTGLAVRFLDNVLTRNIYPIPEVYEVTEEVRRIGLGVMGWHDMLIKLGIPYESQQAEDLAWKIMAHINAQAYETSHELAQERGSFRGWGASIYGPGGSQPWAMRNGTRTTIAPTGTISLIAGCSSGIEPLFALSYEHHGLEGRLEGQKIWSEAYKEHMREVHFSDEHGTCGHTELFKTANEIAVEWHVRHQAAFQVFTDNAVSKTINLPKEASVDDVRRAYNMAWDLGCKGITVYRDGSKSGQVLTSSLTYIEESDKIGEVNGMDTQDRGLDSGAYGRHPDSGAGIDFLSDDGMVFRPTTLNSKSIKQPTPFGNMYVHVSELRDGEPYELFVTIGKAGSDVQAMSEALGRVVSVALKDAKDRRGTLEELGYQFAGIGGSSVYGLGQDRVTSIPDAISKAITRYLSGRVDTDRYGTGGSVDKGSLRQVMGLCPDCGYAALVREEGCMSCKNCGYSRC